MRRTKKSSHEQLGLPIMKKPTLALSYDRMSISKDRPSQEFASYRFVEGEDPSTLTLPVAQLQSNPVP